MPAVGEDLLHVVEASPARARRGAQFGDVRRQCEGRAGDAGKNMQHKRFTTAAGVVGGAIYACGGYDTNRYLDSVERLDPREGHWSPPPFPPAPHAPPAPAHPAQTHMHQWASAPWHVATTAAVLAIRDSCPACEAPA